MADYLERYVHGEHERVWAELQALGDRVREDRVYAAALAVARETMLRVRRNLELLISRLAAMGFAFDADREKQRWLDRPPRLATPHEQTRGQLEEIESELGPLPISLRAFYEVVGAVNLVGKFPSPPGEDAESPDLMGADEDGDNWSASTELDPLFVYGLQTNYDNWREARADEQRRSGYQVLLFPDFLVKYGYSGVGTVYIKAPAATMDAPLMFQGDTVKSPQGADVLFVDYLRFALARGGFPGISLGESDPPIGRGLLARLVEGFEAL